jgi:hypothetical protein
MKRTVITILAVLCCCVLILQGCSREKEETAEPELVEYKSEATNVPAVYSLNRNLPKGYKLLIPFQDLSSEELEKRWSSKDPYDRLGSVYEIEIYKDDVLVGYFFTMAKEGDSLPWLDKYTERSKIKDSDPNSEKVTLIKEVKGEDLNYTLFYIEGPYSPNMPKEEYEFYSKRYFFIGEFPKSADSTFHMIFYTSKEDAIEIFDTMNLRFIRNEEY